MPLKSINQQSQIVKNVGKKLCRENQPGAIKRYPGLIQ